MTTAANVALNEPRALRSVLAAVRASRETEQAMLASRTVFNEINSIDEMEHVMGVRAGLVADEIVIVDDPKMAARKLDKGLVFLLEVATGGMPDGDDQ